MIPIEGERQRWQAVGEMFDAAAELDGDARRALLESQADAGIRAEVEALLQADDRTAPWLAEPTSRRLAPWLLADLDGVHETPVPSAVGHFVILGELGRGGMGLVLRARDQRLQRDVAIKIVSDVADPEARDNLLREARAASALRHPRIVAVYDVGRDGELDYIVLELVDGRSLADCIPVGGLPVVRATAWALQIAEALAHAHAHGVVHRDLKAANVMIGSDGTAKVLDFGIAKRLDGTAGDAPAAALPALAEGTLSARFGTPAAMSPEQASAAPLDVRSDVFSFGSLLYEMLTGASAFRRDSAERTRRAVLEEEPAPLAALRRDVPRRLARLLRATLAKDPRDRPADGAALVTELQRVARELAGARGRRVTALVAGLGVATAAILLWAWPRAGTVGPERFGLLWDDASGHPQSGPTLSRDGLRLAFVQPDERQIAQIWSRPVSGGMARMLTHEDRPAGRPRWSPSGETIVFDLAGRGVWKIPAAGGPATQVLASGHDAAFSPDGARLVFDDGGALSIANADGTEARPIPGIPPDFWSESRAPAFSPDGATVAYFQPENGPYGDLWLADVERGGSRRVTFDAAEGGDPVWTPDGKSIVYSSSRGGAVNLWRLDLAASKPTPITRGSGDDREPVISSDGKRLLFVTARDSYALATFDPATGKRADLLERRIAITHPSFSPDGRSLVFFSNERALYLLDRGAGRQEPRRLSPPGELAILPEWSADGRHIDYYSRAPQPAFRSMSPDGSNREVVVPGWAFETHHGAMLDPARRRVVYTAMQGATAVATRIRDLADGGERALAQPVIWARWSPDGKSLAGRALDRSLVVCDAESGQCRSLSANGTEPRWVEGGRVLYFVRYVDLYGPYYEATELWRVNADGTEERRLAALAGSAHPLQFFFDAATDGSVVWCDYRPGTREIWRADLP